MFHTSFGRAGAQRLCHVACASLALAVFTHAATLPADAQSERRAQKARTAQPAKPLVVNGPLTALVSLNQQRMYVYDANGLVTQTPISSGRAGHETPKGIYSILEKKVFHESNIYLGAKMPHMQRLTMTGIALHGGVIPGYPASGGCVRLPFDFARRFFDLTDINQRVVIAPDVNTPVAFEHETLFSALPSATSVPGNRAELPGETAIRIGTDVAEAVLGVSSAHAATEPPGRTLESAAEARKAERERLVTAADAAARRSAAAVDTEKAAGKAVAEARDAAKAARVQAGKLDRAAGKAAAALKSQDRKLRALTQRLAKGKMRADKLEELRSAEAAERARLAPLTAEAEQAKSAADAAAAAIKTADEAVATAQDTLKAAKADIKSAAGGERAAKLAVARFDRLEQNRSLPVSVFISAATSTISVRQGFERVLEMPVTIANPEQELDTVLFTALDWKDETRTALRWTATEVNEHTTRVARLDDTGTRNKKRRAADVRTPDETSAAKAQRTLDRITIPKEAAEQLAEVVKPGSTLIVSSYDVSKSETRYAGTDFIVQMPEVVAKITKPTPRPRPVEMVEESGGGCFFFCPSYSSNKQPAKERKRQRTSGSKSAAR